MQSPLSPCWPSLLLGRVGRAILGARGQFAYRKSFPGYNSNDYHLAHRMVLDGGAYRLLGKKNMAGIGVGGTIYTGDMEYYVAPKEPEESHWYEGEDYESQLRRNWYIPFHAELQYMRFPSGKIGKGRYYRAGIRTTRFYLRDGGNWKWDIVDGGNLSLDIGAGYGWKMGPANNVRLEGQFILDGEWYVFQLAMNFGRWWGNE